MNKIKLVWNKLITIFDIMNLFKTKKETPKKHRNPELSSGLVKVAHLIKSNTSETQIVKINNKYYKVRELG